MQALEVSPKYNYVSRIAEDIRRTRRTDVTTLPPFADVMLKDDYNFHGLSLPAGAVGRITDVLPALKAYTVEFGTPYECVETVAMWMVKPTNA